MEALARGVGLFASPWPSVLRGRHRDAIDRAGCNTQLTSGTQIVDDGVHPLRCTNDRVDWTGLNAQRATDTLRFVDQGQPKWSLATAVGIEWQGRSAGQRGEGRDNAGTTRWASIDLGEARVDCGGIGQAPFEPALAALRLRQQRIDLRCRRRAVRLQPARAARARHRRSDLRWV